MRGHITGYHLILILAGFLFPFPGHADCGVVSESTEFVSQNSFTVASTAQTITSGSGFSCSGLTSVLSSTVTATVSSTTNASGTSPQLYNSSTGTYLPYSICKDSSCSSTYSVGGSLSWQASTLSGLLALLTASDGTIPIYLRTATGSNLPAGTYTDTINISWSYSLCLVSVLVCSSYTGTSAITVTLVVTDFCYIDSAPDITFGSAALPGAFSSITDSISVRCTLNSAYTVNLTSSNAESGDWRQMSASVDGTVYYLQYQIVQSGGTLWSSSSDYSESGTGLSQSIGYTARINASQDAVPAGSYSDTVKVTVTY